MHQVNDTNDTSMVVVGLLQAGHILVITGELLQCQSLLASSLHTDCTPVSVCNVYHQHVIVPTEEAPEEAPY